MYSENPFSSNAISTGLFLPRLKLIGPQQMALDEYLLEKSINSLNPSLTLRFYEWEGIWLSLGKNQLHFPENWKRLAAKGKLKLVRRPSGGSAVLHGGGLTYSLIWPSPPKKKREAYLKASEWLQKGFLELGMPLNFGAQSQSSSQKNCFARSTSADLVDADGHKRIGSAQRWKQGHLLQHGEILLDPPKELWIEVFQSPPPKKAPSFIPRKELDLFLYGIFKKCAPSIRWEISGLKEKSLKEVILRSKSYLLT